MPAIAHGCLCSFCKPSASRCQQWQQIRPLRMSGCRPRRAKRLHPPLPLLGPDRVRESQAQCDLVTSSRAQLMRNIHPSRSSKTLLRVPPMPKPTAAVSERPAAPEMYATRLRAHHHAASRGVILHLHGPQLSRLGHTPYDATRLRAWIDVKHGFWVLQFRGLSNHGREPCLGTRRLHFRNVRDARDTRPTRPCRVRSAHVAVALTTSPFELRVRRPQGEAMPGRFRHSMRLVAQAQTQRLRKARPIPPVQLNNQSEKRVRQYQDQNSSESALSSFGPSCFSHASPGDFDLKKHGTPSDATRQRTED